MWNQAVASSGGTRNTPMQSSTSGTVDALKYPLSAIGEIIPDGVNGTPRFGTETRPRNLAVMWCIKAWNAPVNQGNIDVAALVKELAALKSATPVGAIVAIPKADVPPGYLELDGSVQSTATYPDLAAYLGTTFNTGGEGAGNFRLPDSRGEFLRGWDHGRGVDAGRALGGYQLDMLKSHTHEYSPMRGSGVVNSVSNKISAQSDANADNGATTGATGGAETRPRNLAIMWCIKAWNAPVNQGNIDIAALAASIAALDPENRRKTSPWVPVSISGSITFAHGFGVDPWGVSLEMLCVTAATGFPLGTRLTVAPAGGGDGGSGSTSSPIGVWADGVNAYAKFGAATGPLLVRTTDGVLVTVPTGGWHARLKVEK
ncbi:tail fiber protein [Pseudomonas sp. TH05]|nr:tail fiber protein [Pseudomonas sp. TH07]MBK5557559.1 tail fiber protein [Pseudomonas sp. TH05]